MAHYLGRFFLGLGAAIIFVFSVTLAYSLFISIAPPDMPWFPWAAMGLTEFGLLCWLAGFMLTRHDPAAKTIALLMIFACLLTVVLTDAMELAHLFHVSPIFANIYYYVLIVMLCAHILAFLSDLFVMYFSQPGHSFVGQGAGNSRVHSVNSQANGNLNSRSNSVNSRSHGNLNSHPAVTVREIQQMVEEAVTGHLVATSEPDFLEQRQLPRPQKQTEPSEEREVVTLAHVGTVIKGAVSSLMKRRSKNTNTTLEPENVPGDLSETTFESGLPGERSDLDVWADAYEHSGRQAIETFPAFVRRMKGIEEEQEQASTSLDETP